MITQYLESTMDFAKRNNTPIFTFSWSTTLPHDNLNDIQLADDTYFEFLSRMMEKGHLENTILIFMGDHGYRFGGSRETLIGYFEDKLPNLWIRLPDRLKEKFPHWQKNLELNSK
jgi:membrane-anchored protein YejM (alkaline phosphatase superfamily)